MKATYRVLAYLIPVIVALQASSSRSASSVSGTASRTATTSPRASWRNGGSTGDIGFALHGFGAMAVALVALVLLIVSFFAKIEGGVKWARCSSSSTSCCSGSSPSCRSACWAIGVLHGLNAFVLFGLG